MKSSIILIIFSCYINYTYSQPPADRPSRNPGPIAERVIESHNNVSKNNGPSGSMTGERGNSSQDQRGATIPVVPYVLTNETKNHLDELKRITTQMSWLKRLLAGCNLLNLFTDNYYEQTSDILLKVKFSDWQAAAKAFQNLDAIKRQQIEQTVDFAILDLDRRAADDAANGVRSDRIFQERRFWNNFAENLDKSEKNRGYLPDLDDEISTTISKSTIIPRPSIKHYLFVEDKITASTYYNISENGQRGMSIYPHFTLNNSINVELEVNAYFYFKSGPWLKDFNNQYNSIEGQVATGKKFLSLYNRSRPVSDFHLFIPYSELHLAENSTNDLCFNICIFGYGNKLDSSQYYYFTLKN